MFRIVEDFGKPQIGKEYWLTMENIKWRCENQGFLGTGNKTNSVFFGMIIMPDNNKEQGNATWNGRVWEVSPAPYVGIENCLAISRPTDWEY